MILGKPQHISQQKQSMCKKFEALLQIGLVKELVWSVELVDIGSASRGRGSLLPQTNFGQLTLTFLIKERAQTNVIQELFICVFFTRNAYF